MTRTASRIALEFVVTIVVALVILGVIEGVRAGDGGAGIVEGVRLLFLFMDIGLGVWLVTLIVIAARTRGARPGIRITVLLALIGALANLATVTVVGLAQQGEPPTRFIGYAVEAGLSFLIGAAIVVPLVHRMLPRQPPEARDRPDLG